MWLVLLATLAVSAPNPKARLVWSDVGRCVLTGSAVYAGTRIVTGDNRVLNIGGTVLLGTGAAAAWATRPAQKRSAKADFEFLASHPGADMTRSTTSTSLPARRAAVTDTVTQVADGELPVQEGRKRLRARLVDIDPDIRVEAMRLLLFTWDELEAPAVLITDPDPMVRRETMKALEVWSVQPGVDGRAAWVLLNTGAQHEPDARLRQKWLAAAGRTF